MSLYKEMEGLLQVEPLDLVRAASLLGRLESSPSDVQGVLDELDRMGAELHDRFQAAPPEEGRL